LAILAAIAFALVAFGLSWTNLETLGWSMQWSSQLAIVFFLADVAFSARRVLVSTTSKVLVGSSVM
jgi:hypothetical protein